LKPSTPADERDISSAIEPNSPEKFGEESIQIISQVQKIKQLYLSLVRNAQKEILLIFPTTNAIRREEGVGIFAELRRASQRGIMVRILTPEDDFVKTRLEELRGTGMVIRQIETPTETKFKLLIIDKMFSLVIETRDDSKADFEDAVGLATFSNSKFTVLPYVTIFQSFWRETDLYERAREADRIKDEFVNIAAHELRNPISPIMASGDFAMEEVKRLKEGKIDQQTLDSLEDNISMMVRNATKLYKLSEDILQVSRIESGTFTLNNERIDLKLLLDLAIQDAKKRVKNESKPIEIRLDYRLNENGNDGITLFCDSSKINQVLYNLLDNAVKFTEKGGITVSAGMHNTTDIIVKVEDSGKGIDPEIRGRLFTKFASKSDGGTGIGLYLAKKIIEAHGGIIWAANNPSGAGTIFSFTLPVDLQLVAENGHVLMDKNELRGNIDKYVQKGHKGPGTKQ